LESARAQCAVDRLDAERYEPDVIDQPGLDCGGWECLGSAAATEEQRVTTVETRFAFSRWGSGPKGEPGCSYSRGGRTGGGRLAGQHAPA
jgi:hypothetical protein